MLARSAALASAFATTVSGLSEEYVAGNAELLFENFKADHGKKYENAAEEQLRLQLFKANMVDAARLEKLNPKATFGASKFADLSAAEFKVYHSLSVPAKPSPPAIFSDAQVANTTGSSVDWRQKGAVTQVKNQGQCGSCWSFSSTGGIEGAWFLAGNKLTSVSEQELVSCDKVDQGCNGGLMDNAYEWLVSSKKGQITTEASYPYTSGEGSVGSCKSVTTVGATISGHKDVTHSESQMKAWVIQNGPLPVAADAQEGWQSYQGGVMSTCSGKSLDHGVMVVGVTPDYWIVKNSWGATWGESGYIRLAYGSDQCGLTQSPTAALV